MVASLLVQLYVECFWLINTPVCLCLSWLSMPMKFIGVANNFTLRRTTYQHESDPL